MLNLTATIWSYLTSQAWRPITVYEIEAFAGRSTLYYGSRDVTWGGHSYTGLAVSCSPIKQQKDFFVPDCTVVFSNVTNVLGAYLSPTDTLTGARMTIRLLFEKADGSIETDSLVLFRGEIDPPQRVTEKDFPLVVRGLIDGRGAQLPGRRLAIPCSWSYANLRTFDGNGHCSYQKSATANGSGVVSTALVLNATTASGAGTNSISLTLAAASTFVNGSFIKIGSGDPVTVSDGGGTTSLTLKDARTWSNGDAVVPYFANGDMIKIGTANATPVAIASGGGTSSLTLAAARSWSSGNAVRYADCPGRTLGECTARGMPHRYGGHPAVDATARIGTLRVLAHNGFQTPGASQFHPPFSLPSYFKIFGQAGEVYAKPGDPVPVGYGRRRITPKIVELGVVPNPSDSATRKTTFHVISVGKISAVKNWFINQKKASDTYVPGGDKKNGIYVRLGDVGINDPESKAEYISDPTTQVRSQNIDYESFAGIAYSEEGYLILTQQGDRFTASGTDEEGLEVDCEFLIVQAYNADGTPNGSPAWSVSPIWQACDWLTADAYGMRRLSTDIDMAVAKDSADYASPLITSTEASTTVTVAQGSASTQCKVKSTEGFILGRRVDVNSVANTVAGVVSSTELKLGTAVTQSIGQTVVQRPQRFESHIYIDSIDKGSSWLQRLLEACRGYVTYDAGKIQLRIERDTCKERLTDGALDLWTSSTNLTNWTEDIAGGSSTITQETSDVHTVGGNAAKLTFVSGDLWFYQALPSLEPGRWYRLAVWAKANSTTPHVRLAVRNTTQTLEMTTDGMTWGAFNSMSIDVAATTSYALYEVTFKVREDFGAADAYQLVVFAYGTGGSINYYDDLSLRGPYAGDFREFTDAKLMGWKEGSFVWSLDTKDRETNRVIVGFRNESGMFGDDEVIVNDFIHQETHIPKEKRFDIPAICDRDQATRIAFTELGRLRTLGPGCEFIGSPMALALQPGDVILVSHTVPGWARQEQRVIETQIQGLGNADEYFVLVRTEDYKEGLYSDVGATQRIFAATPDIVVTVTVTRNAGGVLDLSISTSDASHAVTYFDIYMDDTSGFERDETNRIGRTQTGVFTYTMPVDQLDVVRYFQVVAVTERGEVSSGEFAVTVSRADTVTSGYSGNYQFPTAATSPYDAGYNAFDSHAIANVNDTSDSDYDQATASATEGYSDGNDESIEYHSFGSGTHTGKPYVRAYQSGSPSYGKLELYYTLDRTAGTPTWVQFGTVAADAAAHDYTGPEVTVDYAKLGIKARLRMLSGGFTSRTATGRIFSVAFDQKA